MEDTTKADTKATVKLRLTPHTLRLIRLITSTSSSAENDHIQHAIAILSSIASKSDPVLLWDIIARLYASLTNVNENDACDRGGGDDCMIRREYIALAMEHVAKYIPNVDRRHFMTDCSEFKCSTKTMGESNDKTWLKVQDLLPIRKGNVNSDLENEENWELLDQVLQNGRLLLSSSVTQFDNNINSYKNFQSNEYEQEDAMLSSLDTSTLISTSAEEQGTLLTERIALQRKILASRLGFGRFLSMNISTKDLVADEDLLPSTSKNYVAGSVSQKKLSARERNLLRIGKRRINDALIDSNMMKQSKKIKYKSKNDDPKNSDGLQNHENGEDSDDNDEEEKLILRNILLLSLNQQPKVALHQHSRKYQYLVSHETPQNILATDMIYNSVHPSWHVRHGSLLGLLALLKSWRSSLQGGKIEQSTECFGKWPHDILTRCLCILALDRFGDFSGSTIKTKPNKGISAKDNENEETFISAAMTAPVREVAARVLSFLLEIAPSNDVQIPSYRILVKLSQYELEWEVRHGAMLGFKYIAQVIGAQNNILAPYQNNLDKVWNNITSHAHYGLQDDSDDVKGTSAQVLNCLITKETMNATYLVANEMQPKEIISDCVQQTWAMLKQVQTTSSCTLELLNLFSSMIAKDSTLVLNSMGILESQNPDNANELLQKFNEFLYFDDYSVRLRCFESVTIIAEPIASAFMHKDTKMTGNATIQLYCNLVVNMFDSYIHGTYNDSENNENDEKHIKSYVINGARDKAWIATINAILGLVRNENTSLIRDTFVVLLFRVINIDFSQRLQGHVTMKNFMMEYDMKSKTSRCYENLHHAAIALIEFYLRIGRLVDVDAVIATFIICLIESPFLQFCEVGCILLKFIARGKEDKQCIFVSEFSRVIFTIFHNGAKCIMFDNESIDNIRKDERFIELTTQLLINAMNECLSIEATLFLNHDATNKILEEVIKMWSKVFKVFGINPNQYNLDFKKNSKQRMRLNSSMVGTIISFGLHHLPPKLTSIIRTSMTSIKNEDSVFRAQRSCEDIVNLIHLLRQSSKQQVIDKIMENILKIACHNKQIDQLPADFTQCGMMSSREALRMIVRSIPQNNDLTYENVLWSCLGCLKNKDPASISNAVLTRAMLILCEISSSFINDTKVYEQVISDLLPTSTMLSCTSSDAFIRQQASIATTNICCIDPLKSVPVILPYLMESLTARNYDALRLGACSVLSDLVEKIGVALLPFVHCILPAAMSMMTDSVEQCSKIASSTFAKLVRLAPLVNTDTKLTNTTLDFEDESFRRVVDHLIHGKPLPPTPLPQILLKSLIESEIKLRDYQKEGISWMTFLRTLNLNGALTDEMGLGKTLQSLCAVATSHLQETSSMNEQSNATRSLIVCPSSVVGHWMNEIKHIDKGGRIFQPLRYCGNFRQRVWKEQFETANIIVTSYSVLRSDAQVLTGVTWIYCILDEGHLVKNPKTLTAKAAQKIRSKHKLLLSGSPVQNKVQELWAIFDWLMPNYLGSTLDFAEQFARDITKGQLPGASANDIRKGLRKLKILHQQVLPFILRREKSEVLTQLPPKIITDITCPMSKEQYSLYDRLSRKKHMKAAIKSLETLYGEGDNLLESGKKIDLGKDALQSLICLRMLCTHPLLVQGKIEETDDDHLSINRYNTSGKISALKDLLGTAGIFDSEITAADNDQSFIYVQNLNNFGNDSEEEISTSFEYNEDIMEGPNLDRQPIESNESKCLIFAQFNQSLDILEDLLLKPLMPSLRYVRLDGRVEAGKRDDVVNQFVNDEGVKCMLLTTKVGSLGLNLQVADTVIFLEPDYNPHVDLQAMDRVHRIGQDKTVKVYRLITLNSIEEKIMSLQKAKLAISDAIVNTDNSTMFSMGTDKLLDLFDAH